MIVPLVYGLGVTVCNKGINSREMFYVLVRVRSNIMNGIVTQSLTLRVLVTYEISIILI